MNVLIITSHPVTTSFNAALAASVRAGLEQAGHVVQVADLCAEGFDPVMTAEDFGQFEDQPPPADIQREMDRVEWADGLIFVFPVWWWSVPAVLKGWIDRVMRYGWAWIDPKDPESGYLRDRKILVLATAGDSAEAFAKRGYDVALRTQLNVGTWSYCHFRDAGTRLFHELHHDTPVAVRAAYLAEAEQMGREF